jgi:putative transposase
MGMDEQRVRKTFTYQLTPTPDQERTLATVVWRCRALSNAGLHERRAAWERCGVWVTFAMHRAQRPASQAVRPEDNDRTAPVVQDALHRLDNAFAACCRRVAAGARPGSPRFRGKDRSHRFTDPQVGAPGGAATLDGGRLTRSTIGRIRLGLRRPLQGSPKTVTISREADGWYACISCVEASIAPLPAPGHETETGSDVGLQVFLVTADGDAEENPRPHRTGERQRATAQRRVSRRKVVALRTRTHQQVQRQRRDFPPQTALALLLRTSYVDYLDDVPVANMGGNHHLAQSSREAGWAAFRTILAATAAGAGRQVIAVAAQ